MVISVDAEVTKDKDASGAVRRGTKQAMEDAMASGFALSQELVPEDRGTLRHSGFEPTWRNDGSLVWGYRAGHALPMEEGTQPFYPPLEPLLEWSQRVSGSKGLGYYVARHKIPEEGITAQPYAGPGAEKASQYLQSRGIGGYIEDEL